MTKPINAQNMSHLPEELIHEILINLPVKPLLRLKTVSKQWRCLISSKSFTKAHLQKSSDSIDRHNLIYESYERRHWSLRSYSLKYLLNGPAIPAWDHGPIGNWFSCIQIPGSCNGLVLIHLDDRHLLVWNPSTGLMKYIPPASYPKPQLSNPEARLLYGFGYDDWSDDYKVVYIFSFSNTYRTAIYSLRSDSWKEIENFKIGSPVRTSSGKLVNGKLHWLGFDEFSGWDIVALDVAKEGYEIVGRPQHFSSYDDRWIPSVINLGGYLGMWWGNICCRGSDVWVMMKYGEAESWTKIWRESEYPSPERNIGGYGRPIWFRENEGDIAVGFHTSIEVYNVKNKSLNSPVHVVNLELLQINFYVESLVSPFGGDGDNLLHHQMAPERITTTTTTTTDSVGQQQSDGSFGFLERWLLMLLP